MSKFRVPYLCVEAPDNKAEVDFLHHKLGVSVSINNGEVHIRMTRNRGEDSYVYDVLLDEVLSLGESACCDEPEEEAEQ